VYYKKFTQLKTLTLKIYSKLSRQTTELTTVECDKMVLEQTK